MILRDVLADRLQLRRFRRPDAAANPHPVRCHLEVQAGTIHAAEDAVREACSDVRLQRRLVLAESRVAEWPEERRLRVRLEFRRVQHREIGVEGGKVAGVRADEHVPDKCHVPGIR